MSNRADSPAFYEERIRLLQAANERLHEALETITDIAIDDASMAGRLTSMVVVAQLALAYSDGTLSHHD